MPAKARNQRWIVAGVGSDQGLAAAGRRRVQRQKQPRLHRVDLFLSQCHQQKRRYVWGEQWGIMFCRAPLLTAREMRASFFFLRRVADVRFPQQKSSFVGGAVVAWGGK